jgi:hypothetical protein
MIHLNPEFCRFSIKGRVLVEADFGKTLGELGFQNRDIVTVQKLAIQDPQVEETNLIDPVTGKFVSEAYEIVSNWYTEFSNEEGLMTKDSAIRFINRVTHEACINEDRRITLLFGNHDADKDGIL